MQLYLDMDGVLADFNKAAIPLLDNQDPEWFDQTYGQDEFWKRIHSNPNFFLDLELMPDAMQLYNATKHLKPIILTGIPMKMDAFSNQKLQWAKNHFGEDQPVICCRARKKSKYCEPGDILVDDRTVYKHLWERVGGVYVVHTSADKSLKALEDLGVLEYA